MSGSDWSVRIAIVGCLAAIGLIVWGLSVSIYSMGHSSGFHQAEANGYAAQYPSDTQKRIEECDGKRPISDVTHCIEEAIRASHDSQRSEQDLQAQRDMSEWAWWLLVVSIAQIPLGIAGLIALIVTIRQAQEANDIAREAVAEQTRPWIDFTLNDDVQPTLGVSDKEIDVSAHFIFKNHGVSPATDVRSLFLIFEEPISSEEIQKAYRNVILHDASAGSRTAIFPNGVWKQQPTTTLLNHCKKETPLTVVMMVSYRSPSDPRYCHTIKTYKVYCSERPHRGWTINLDMPANSGMYGNCKLVDNPDDAGVVT